MHLWCIFLKPFCLSGCALEWICHKQSGIARAEFVDAPKLMQKLKSNKSLKDWTSNGGNQFGKLVALIRTVMKLVIGHYIFTESWKQLVNKTMFICSLVSKKKFVNFRSTPKKTNLGMHILLFFFVKTMTGFSYSQPKLCFWQNCKIHIRIDAYAHKLSH